MPAAVVLYVADLNSMKAFYERCFGMVALGRDTDQFCVLTSNDWELSMVPVSEAISGSVADPPERREGTPIKLAFEVADIEGLRPVVAAMLGTLDPIESAWTFRGYRHLDGIDPEGNVVQLRQRAFGD